ncbi:MAG: hypothetical protein ABJ360_15105 [Roseobacter sp.]|uniref:hypothetical protein n=1 Tax=Parasphingorhabdus sp. TaxID=2709688 RepID=UPI0032665F4D
MHFARILLSPIAALIFIASAPGTSAEEWVLLNIEGEKPSRHFRLVDRDSVDRTSQDSVRLQLGVIYEGQRDETLGVEAAQAIIDMTVNCAEHRGEISKAEFQNDAGEVLGVTDGPAYGDVLDTSRFGKQLLQFSCEEHSLLPGVSFAHLRLSEILPFWLNVIESPAIDNQD